jgi:hypothetical protein
MAHNGENVRPIILEEFVDDATPSRMVSHESRSQTDRVRDVVHRIASEMGVTQYQLKEIVERVLAANGSSLEERVRKELQNQKDSRSPRQNNSKAG